jgi:hypothetical protein
LKRTTLLIAITAVTAMLAWNLWLGVSGSGWRW